MLSLFVDPGAAPEGAPEHQPVQQGHRQEPGHRAPQGADEVPAGGQEGQAATPQGDRRREGGRQGACPLEGTQGGEDLCCISVFLSKLIIDWCNFVGVPFALRF